MFINSTVNKHNHLLLNGQIIEHSHPFNAGYDSSPLKNHHHTEKEFILLSLISNPLFAVFLTVPFLLLIQKVLECKNVLYTETLLKINLKKFPPNKAPPICLFN